MTAFSFLAVLVVVILLGMPIGFAMALLPTVYIAETGAARYCQFIEGTHFDGKDCGPWKGK